ncbi:MAG TPA: hypothetical protein VJO12_05495 [Stellaceae bacterium]|nr:hypothetical protein [Stellaceae bacterium]
MGEIMSKRARLRAIHHLLEYAVTEVHELGLHQLEQLLTAATATVTNEMKGRGHGIERPHRPQIRLVVDTDNREKGNGTKV